MPRSLLYLLLPACFYIVSCSPGNVKEDNSLKLYFDSAGATGCFGLYDNAKGNFTIYNLSRFRDSVYTPASTFKIVNSLVGIETGRVKDDSTVLKWDSTLRGRSECNTDMSMYTAFRLSCPPYYRQLARRIGKDTMQRWLDTLGRLASRCPPVISGRLTRLLLDASRVSADEAGLRMSRALSAAVPAPAAAGWAEGFLAGSGLLLVHDDKLLALADGWLAGLTPEAFTAVLPALRRTFGEFAPPERRAIGQKAALLDGSGRGPVVVADGGDDLDEERAALAAGAAAMILGWPRASGVVMS